MPVIEVRELSFTYRNGKAPAVSDISFSVDRGEFVGIIGPTGAGKTTLCRCLTGVVPHIYSGKLSGEVTVNGLDVKVASIAELAQSVGFVQQDAESQLLMTDIEKEVVFPLENLGIPRGEMRRRLEYVLELVRLTPYRKRHPFYLSGGQKQRVVLASALAMNPDVLILDEATSELDPVGAEEVLSVVAEINRQGKTVILIEHNMEELAQYADRIIVLDRGRLVADAPSRDVLSDIALLSGLQIYPPQVTQVAINLARAGIQIDRIPITIEEARSTFEEVAGRGLRG
ncbi:MAG: ATP-binding cassette domain-containing protein [Bacillota bacterium]